MIEARGRTKYYGSVLAVQQIDFSLRPHFITKTLLRGEPHRQIVSVLAAMGLIVTAQSRASALHTGTKVCLRYPTDGGMGQRMSAY